MIIKGYNIKSKENISKNLYLHHDIFHIKKENVKIMKIQNVQFVDLKEM